MFKRKIYDKLLEWKKESAGKTALMVEGARRIGKSTVVEEFARREYKNYILIDFSSASAEVKALFEDMSDLEYFFLQLQLICHADLQERNSLIVFDEVQLFPLARQAIKHLVWDGRYDYIETGSLISIRKNVADILIPSEEEKLLMNPMDFEEFLWATEDTVTMRLLQRMYESKRSMGDAAHRQLMRKFRLYMLIGGMPQAIDSYLQTNNFKKVDHVKRTILNLYLDDFGKLDQTGYAKTIFSSVPAQLNKNTSRYQVSSVLEGKRAADILGLLEEMKASRVINLAYRTSDPGVGLAAYKDLRLFKIFVGDTGLYTTLSFLDRDFTENKIYEQLLNDKLAANLGYLYENVVAQMLTAKGDELYYYSFPSKTSNHTYEIDFLIARQNKICPLEVKSSRYRSHASLDIFKKKYSGKILQNYVIHTKDFMQEKDVMYIPVYMVPFL